MRVDLNEWLPLRRRVVFREDGGDGAYRNARVAVDAFVRLDVEHPRTLVDAVDRTFVDAGAVLHVDAGLCDHVGHATSTPSRPAVVVKPQHTRREHVRDIVVASCEGPQERQELTRFGRGRTEAYLCAEWRQLADPGPFRSLIVGP